ncbi:MAG: hypothetical protein CMO46_01745 [Verrucomicrobiales bacterium]|nr:hypothetical protein [Verrucomicrobiales bacterium]|tara:strand:- start:2177 stop:2899 length:723 start_codon:yes stop_codon:yes gene_type:complete
MLLTNRVIVLGIIALTSWTSGFGQDVDILNSNNLKNLFNSLGHESYEVRQKTQNLILDQGKINKDLVLNESFEFYIKTKDPEVKYRLRSSMLEIIGGNLKPEGFIGIRMVDAPMRINNDGEIENIRAVRILSVVPNTAASKAGLRPGDQITRLDGEKFPNQGLAYVELSKYIRAKSSGENVKLSVTRGFGVNMKKMDIDIKLGERPEGLGSNRKVEAFNEWFQKNLEKNEKKLSDNLKTP